MAKVSKGTERAIKLDLIDPPVKADRLEIDMDEVRSLAENIKEVGLIYPIIVRAKGDRFSIIAGHCRYLAHGILGESKIRCVVRDISDVEVALLRASENLKRISLSVIEEAHIYSNLEKAFSLSHDEIGKRFGKSPGVVKRRLDLLKMPEELQRAVHKKEISYGVAEELWRISDVGSMQYYLAFAIEHGVTVTVARGWVKDWKDSVRRAGADIEGSRGERSPLESRPVWVTCDTCHGPMELGSETVLRVCSNCVNLIEGAGRESKNE
ncbi:MAG: ParB/RepB/Spo0J family partition protein [Gammaproteobacteria bacterium]|nr:ParB/RepB/Spo0J family partition protein [Gammaproteobacteria bacterium]MBU2685656.1 ParB/RepB/Spo0J family partition protein [Gammaproteobacteria bacterium]